MTTPAPFRLPTDVQPLRYSLTLTPDLKDFTFQGEAAIDIEVSAPTSRIMLNAIDLEVPSADLSLPGDKSWTPKIDLDESSETATFSFDQDIPMGTATLNIRFAGTLNDELRGFYRSQYTDTDGQERLLATTQFEATDARRAFPCWDEPAVKATFRVTLIIPSDLVAISNTPVESEMPTGDGLKTVRFEESPRMSTYLLAFIIGDFVAVEEQASNGTVVRVWATRGKEEQGRFAVENAVNLLGYFNEYFGVPYPLPKLDHIAVPDFAAGAMENWGAITYRETAHASTTRRTPQLAPASASWRSSPTKWPICGSVTWSPWSGGTICGSTRASPRGWGTKPSITCIRSGICGPSSSSRTPTQA